MKAYVLIQARPHGDVSQLAVEVARVPGVHSADWVIGPYDVVAEVRDDSVPLPRVVHTITTLMGVVRALAAPVVEEDDGKSRAIGPVHEQGQMSA